MNKRRKRRNKIKRRRTRPRRTTTASVEKVIAFPDTQIKPMTEADRLELHALVREAIRAKHKGKHWMVGGSFELPYIHLWGGPLPFSERGDRGYRPGVKGSRLCYR